MRFSIQLQSFYADGLDFSDSIPDDLIALSENEGKALYQAVNAGSYIYSENGILTASLPRPDNYHIWDESKGCWFLPPDAAAQRKADTVNAADVKRQELTLNALKSIELLQLKLRAGRDLSPSETIKLNQVLDYIDALNSLDVSAAPDVLWP